MSTLKILSLRLRGMKGQLQELGEETDENVENISKMQGQILNLTKGKVNIFDGAGQFRSTYEIMKDISEVWDDLTSTAQADLLETIAGKHRANSVAALLSNWQNVEAAIKSANEAEGSAARENAKYVDSIQGRLDKLTTSWQSFARTFLDSDFLKGLVSGLTKVVEILEWIIDNFGLIGTISAGVIGKNIFSYFKGAKEVKATLNDVVDAIYNLKDVSSEGAEAVSNMASANTEMAESASNMASASTEAAESVTNTASAMTEGAEATANMTSAATEGVEALTNTASTASEAAETITNVASASSESTEALANMASTITEVNEALANTVSAGTETAETVGNLASGTSEFVEAAGNTVSAATEGAETVANLGSAAVEAGAGAVKASGGFKRFFGTLGGKIAIAAAVIGVISLIINQVKKAKEETAKFRQGIIDESNEFLDSVDSFEQAYIKYSGKTNLTAEEESELESAINGTVDALGNKSSLLKDVVNSSNDYVTSLERITDAELKQAEIAAKNKRDNAKLELDDIANAYTTSDQGAIGIVFTQGTRSDDLDETEEVLKIAKEVGGEYYEKRKYGFRVSQYKYGFKLPFMADTSTVVDYYHMLEEYRNRLSDEGLIDSKAYEKTTAVINKLSVAVAAFEGGVYDFAKAQYKSSNGIPKTTEEYLKMRESILKSDDIKTLSVDSRNTIANTLDSEYKDIFDLSTAEVQARKLTGIIKSWGDGTIDGTDEIGTMETFLNMRTAVNNDECSVGDYMSQLEEARGLVKDHWTEDEEKIFNTTFGLDTDTIKQQYEDVYNHIKRDYIDNIDYSSLGLHDFDTQLYRDTEIERIQSLLKGLTATELQAVANIRTEIDWGNTNTDEILAQIKDEAKFIEAMNYTIAIDVETESLDALNSALSESVSGAGLSSESIDALKSRYAELASQGYDLSAMFEETSNGIHLNKNAISEFEQALASQKLSETDEKLEVLKGRYDDLTKEIETCTDAGERASLYSDQQEVAQKINDLATLASQYKGLTSAYNAWQNVESSGSERDMYESIIEGFETVGDEIKRGWYDDGTIKFLELMTGKTDLAGKSASELKEIWNSLDDTIKGTSYSVRDFFTVDKDGNSTSTGAYNFLKAVEQLGKNGKLKFENGKTLNDLITRKDGKKDGAIIGFDFNVVGGDKAVADALGISEEMVQIIQRALDDAGFVVTLDGKYTLLADLKTSAEEANNALKKLQSEGVENLKDLDLNFDFNVDTVEGYQEQLEKALNVLDKFRNEDGTLQTDKDGNLVEGAKQALEIAEYYTAAMDKLTEPKFMQIDTSTVDKELQDPIEKMQEIGDLCKKKHLVALTGDTKELDKVQGEIDKVAKEIEKLDPEVKAQIGIDEDWDAKTIADKIEKGEIEIPAELKLDVQMSEDLKDMRLMMMNQLGLVDDNEVKLKVGYDIDDSTVDKLIKDGKEEVVIEFITENEKWFNVLTDDEKKVVIDLVSKGIDLNNLDDDKKEVVIEYIEKDAEWFNKLDDEEKKVVVNYVAEHGEIDDWSPEAKEAFVKYLVDGGDPDTFDPDDKESWVVYKKDSTEPDGYIPNNPNALVTYNKDSSVPDTYDPKDPDATVKYGKDSLIPDSYIPLDPPATVIFDKDTSAIDTYDPPNFVRTVTYNIKEAVATGASAGKKALQNRGLSPVNGTANVNGTTGKAFKQGSWGTKNSGTALVGELGREVLVRDGRYYTIGDNGAEFIKYKKGDIIFNHIQSDELFKNGRVTSGGGRAKALVDGMAFAQGTAYGYGTGGGEEATVPSFKVGYDYKAASNKDSKKSQNVFDWIEVAIERIEREIDNLDRTANNVYKSWSSRNKALASEIGEIGNEIALQEKAYQGYMNAANEIGLSSEWKKKVQSGAIDIDNITNDTLKEKIDDYRKWYEKALDAKDAIEELKETEAALFAQRFENIQTQYDGILQGYEHTEAMLNEYISQAEEKGYVVSKKYYDTLIANEKSNIAELRKEQAALIAERDNAVNSGKITKYSEEWYNMCNEVDSVTQAIEESTTALLEFDNAMRDIDWSIFDIIQERISDITSESEFLIELMSNKDLFDDNGKFTEQGVATVGLHALNYNTSMYAADEYANEIAKLDKQIKSDPYDQELINRRRELIELQRESILAAEDEKNAIRDLVEEGVEAELSALEEKINLYQESLDSQKD